MTKTYQEDVGTIIELDCGVNIASATAFQIRAKKPSGAEVSWTAALYGTTKVRYTLPVGVLDEVGTWLLQAYVELPTWRGLGESAKLKVYAKFT